MDVFILFFVLWLIFNARVTVEIVILGAVISAVMYAFVCVFLGFSPKKDLWIISKLPWSIAYVVILLYEIIAANLWVMRLVTSAEFEPDPVLIKFHTNLKSNFCRVLLANSITLTPGTITVSLEGDEYVVHCLDRTLAPGIADSRIARIISRLDA